MKQHKQEEDEPDERNWDETMPAAGCRCGCCSWDSRSDLKSLDQSRASQTRAQTHRQEGRTDDKKVCRLYLSVTCFPTLLRYFRVGRSGRNG